MHTMSGGLEGNSPSGRLTVCSRFQFHDAPIIKRWSIVGTQMVESLSCCVRLVPLVFCHNRCHLHIQTDWYCTPAMHSTSQRSLLYRRKLLVDAGPSLVRYWSGVVSFLEADKSNLLNVGRLFVNHAKTKWRIYFGSKEVDDARHSPESLLQSRNPRYLDDHGPRIMDITQIRLDRGMG